MNLYTHFPFCRRKCSYCALYSRAGSTSLARARYVASLASSLSLTSPLSTIYFGGGTPLLCPLQLLVDKLSDFITPHTEFTVEVHPLDDFTLLPCAVNRVSMGIQSFDDSILAAMGRGYTSAQAVQSFRRLRAMGYTNIGFDLIAGYPGVTNDMWYRTLDTALSLEPTHISIYSLTVEPKTQVAHLQLDEEALAERALNQISTAVSALAAAGIVRYEISNYSRPGYECRHNLAVWHGEDYLGLGEGAHGRQGLRRTTSGHESSSLTPFDDALERAIFSLRLLNEGLDLSLLASRFPILAPRLPAWRTALDFHVSTGLLIKRASSYLLTPRGTECCDTILADLI